MRILGTEPLSVILNQKSSFKSDGPISSKNKLNQKGWCDKPKNSEFQ